MKNKYKDRMENITKEEFRQYINAEHDVFTEIKEDLSITLEEYEECGVNENVATNLETINEHLDNQKRHIESYCDEGYCPWGDEEMIFHIPSIYEKCIGNAKSKLEEIVWGYYEIKGTINNILRD